MASNSDRAQRWINRALGESAVDLGNTQSATVFYYGDSIYSYGTHFEMARVMRDKRGEPTFILVNGDTYSITTSGHQSMVRSVIAGSGLPSIILPYSALAGAGVIDGSIRPIHIRADRTQTFHHDQAETPTGDIVKEYKGTREEEYEDEEYVNEYDDNGLFKSFKKDADGHAIKQTVTKTRTVSIMEPNPERRYLNPRTHNVAEWDEVDEVWRWTTTRHWLGDSLIYARIRGRRGQVKLLSSFDYQESGGLYFLCELPHRCPADTVEDAIEALKPESVKMAEEAGLTCTRQGDIFSIPTDLTTREVKRLTPWGKGRIVRRPHVLGTNHTATNVMFATKDRVYARGTMYHDPEGWRGPDHARRRIGDGKTWHLLVRNTVPRDRPQRRERTNTVESPSFMLPSTNPNF